MIKIVKEPSSVGRFEYVRSVQTVKGEENC